MLRTLFLATAGWTMIACLVGIITPAFEWSSAKVTGFESGAP
jgi:hypothetical protein